MHPHQILLLIMYLFNKTFRFFVELNLIIQTFGSNPKMSRYLTLSLHYRWLLILTIFTLLWLNKSSLFNDPLNIIFGLNCLSKQFKLLFFFIISLLKQWVTHPLMNFYHFLWDDLLVLLWRMLIHHRCTPFANIKRRISWFLLNGWLTFQL